MKMIFDRNENKEVIALLGAGSMGSAIARRFAAGRIVLLGDIIEQFIAYFIRNRSISVFKCHSQFFCRFIKQYFKDTVPFAVI